MLVRVKLNLCLSAELVKEYDVYLGRDKLNQEEEYTYVGIKLGSKIPRKWKLTTVIKNITIP